MPWRRSPLRSNLLPARGEVRERGEKMKKWKMIAVVGAVIGMWFLPSTLSAAELKGGLKLGLSLTDIHGSDVRDFPYYDDPDTSWFLRFGFCGGGFISVGLSRTLAIQAEALLSTKGSAQLGIYDRYSFRTSYLEIPLLIKLMIPPGKHEGYFLAGPAMGILISDVMKLEGEPIAYNGFKSTDVGLVLGLGGRIGSRIITELRYTMGMSKSMEQDGVALDIKNTALTLMAGYLF